MEGSRGRRSWFSGGAWRVSWASVRAGELRSRWVGLAAASWVGSCAGLSYMFSLYSQSLRSHLGFSQTQVDLVGMAKDVGGSIGIVSGLLGDLVPPWIVLAVGALQSLLGFGGLWLLLQNSVGPDAATFAPLWLVMLLIAVGTNSATFYNTGGMVTCVKNFPHSRGPVVGLLKGFMGLSGALFTQLYLALYAPDPESFLLLAAWFPALIAVLAMPAIHAVPAAGAAPDPRERRRLLLSLACSCTLALGLLGVNMLGKITLLPRSFHLGTALLSLLAMAFPALFTLWPQSPSQGASGPSTQEAEEGKALIGSIEIAPLSPMHSRSEDLGVSDDAKGAEHVRLRPHHHTPEEKKLMSPGSDPEGPGHLSGRSPEALRVPRSSQGSEAPSAPLEVGDDHSLPQALSTLSFWLLYVSMVGASGSGLTAMNNLAQYGRSLGHGQGDIATAVSLMSIWNFAGRVGGAYLSEYFLLERSIPRPSFMCFTQVLMAGGHLVFAASFPSSLLLGSTIIGLAYGAQWGLMPAVASEVFGLRRFGLIYNTLTSTNPMGSFLLSVNVAGRLYDMESERQASERLAQGLSFATGPSPAPAVPSLVSDAALCLGPQCFRSTFFVLAGSSLAASILSGVLAAKTAKYYRAEVAHRKELMHRAESQGT